MSQVTAPKPAALAGSGNRDSVAEFEKKLMQRLRSETDPIPLYVEEEYGAEAERHRKRVDSRSKLKPIQTINPLSMFIATNKTFIECWTTTRNVLYAGLLFVTMLICGLICTYTKT